MAGYIGKAQSQAVLTEQDPTVPSQTGNSGKYLTTDGTDASWGAIDLSPYAPLASPSLTGTPTAPTATGGTNTTQIATTAYVQGELSGIASDAITEGDSSVEVVDTGSGYITATTDGAERLRIDSSGNLLVGHTDQTTWDSHNGVSLTPSGGVLASRENTVGFFNKRTNDGDIIEFRKDGTKVGSIGVANGDNLYIAADDTTDVGLKFDGDANAIYGCTASGNIRDNAITLGDPAVRFKDLYLAGNAYFNSGYGSAAIAYGCRAWVNFNGTSTVSIRASGGVSSISDNGTGDYTVNLSTTMPDANYNTVAMGRTWPGVQSEGFVIAFGNYAGDGTTGRTTSSLRISSLNQVTNKTDSPYVGVSFFR